MYRITINGENKDYATLDLANHAAGRIFADSGVIVGITETGAEPVEYLSGVTFADEWNTLQEVKRDGMRAYASYGEMNIARAMADTSTEPGMDKVSPVTVLAVLRAFHQDTKGA